MKRLQERYEAGRSQIQHKFHNHFANNSKLGDGIARVEKFLAAKYVNIYSSSDQYVSGQYQSKRLSLVIMGQIISLLLLIYLITFSLGGIPLLKPLDYSKYVNNEPTLLYTSLLIIFVSLLFILYVSLWQEWTHTLYVSEMFYDLKYGSVTYPLNNHDTSQITKFITIIIDYSTIVYYASISPIIAITYIVSIINLAKMYSLGLLVSTVVLDIFVSIFIIQMGAYIVSIVIYFIMITYYIRYKFVEIDGRLAFATKFANNRILMSAMVVHQYWDRQTKLINNAVKRILFVLNYLGYFGIEMASRLLFKSGTQQWVIILGVCLLLMYFIYFLLIFYVLVLIPTAAHKPYNKLLSYISRAPALPLRVKLKLVIFIERLSTDPPIGYTCYDLFPACSYEICRFFRYLCP